MILTPTGIQVFEYHSGLLVVFTPTGIQVFEYQSGLLVGARKNSDARGWPLHPNQRSLIQHGQ